MNQHNGHDFTIPLAVVGVDFRRAPARQRDRLLLSDDERRALAQQLRKSEIAEGLACLDTCNRTEWIVAAEQPSWAAEILRSQMIARDGGAANGDEPTIGLVPYSWVGVEAARHLFEVAAGLESFVMGEKEIASQLHRALERSRAEEVGSPILNGVGMAVGRLTRDTHRLDLTGAGPRGVHDLAVDFVTKRHCAPPKVVVVGLGQIGQKVARSLRAAGVTPILCNRTTTLAWAGDEPVHGLDRLPALLGDVDAAVICTASPSPVVTDALLTERTADTPVLLVDLGIPAQVDPQLRSDAAEKADLEDLQRESGRRIVASWADLAQVRQRVRQAIAEFQKFCQERRFSQLLRRTQERHQRYIRTDIPRVLDEAAADLPPKVRTRLESELKGLVRSYTNAVFRDIREILGEREES